MGLNFFASVEEGKVSAFLLATTGMLCLRYSIMKKKMLMEVGIRGRFYCVFYLTY